MKEASIDMILCDPPYGVTVCKWDSVIPLEPLWKELKRVIKYNGAIVIMATQPFTTDLINSNRKWFKYCWVWLKSKPNGWQHSKNKPMQTTEDVVVFSPASMGHASLLGERRMIYNPQGIRTCGEKTVASSSHGRTMGKREKQVGRKYQAYTGFPSNLLCFNNIIGKQAIHPTQKPVELMEYLIETYSKEGDTILDFAMGSGTTAIACKNLNRSFIGIELDEHYCNIAKDRVNS